MFNFPILFVHVQLSDSICTCSTFRFYLCMFKSNYSLVGMQSADRFGVPQTY